MCQCLCNASSWYEMENEELVRPQSPALLDLRVPPNAAVSNLLWPREALLHSQPVRLTRPLASSLSVITMSLSLISILFLFLYGKERLMIIKMGVKSESLINVFEGGSP